MNITSSYQLVGVFLAFDADWEETELLFFGWYNLYVLGRAMEEVGEFVDSPLRCPPCRVGRIRPFGWLRALVTIARRLLRASKFP